MSSIECLYLVTLLHVVGEDADKTVLNSAKYLFVQTDVHCL